MILSGIPYLYHSNIYITAPNLSEENLLASPKESLYFSPIFLKMGCSLFICSIVNWKSTFVHENVESFIVFKSKSCQDQTFLESVIESRGVEDDLSL